MNAITLASLRPKNGSSLEISHSIREIEAQKIEQEKHIAELRSRRGELLVAGDEKGIKALEREIENARTYIEDAESMLPILMGRRAEALRAEKIDAFRQKLDELDYAGKRQKFLDAWPNYENHAREIAAILSLEQAAFNVRVATQAIVQELASLGVTDGLPDVETPARAAGAWIRCHTLGELVRLPGPFGHPEVVWEQSEEIVTRMVPNFVYNEMLRRSEQKGEKEHSEAVVKRFPKVEGAPIWWPKK